MKPVYQFAGAPCPICGKAMWPNEVGRLCGEWPHTALVCNDCYDNAWIDGEDELKYDEATITEWAKELEAYMRKQVINPTFLLWFGELVNYFIDDDAQFIGPFPGYSVCLFDKLQWDFFNDYLEGLREDWGVSFL